ncbi:MAG: DEAD/DEAH box helicase [Proteobacteria bacterium]|nr:DEAD/DEAH box helicase [Pseudomonadota bacterium]
MVFNIIQKIKTGLSNTPSTAAESNGFLSLGLHELLLKAVVEQGYSTPTPIQVKAIPEVINGRDILGCAQTGTGKTAAFALPILNRLAQVKTPKAELRTLVLAPTRELALQIRDSFVAYGKFTPLESAVVFGGVGIEPQIKAIRNGVDVLVATPGRLLDLIGRRCVDFKNIEILVLDEADRMLDMGFINDIKKILKYLPTKRQNLLFSATIPREVQGLIDSILVNPVRIEVAPVSSTSEQVTQRVYFVPKGDKRALLLHIMDNEAVIKGLVFTRTKHNANKLEDFLEANGVKAAAIHGNKSQGARQKALEGFREGKVQILVASDLAARGIDIDDITHVINFEMPNEPETYVHRIGRTGRAKARGVAISLCDHEERKHLVQIEKMTKLKVPVVTDHPFAKAFDSMNPPPSSQGRPGQRRGSRPSGRSQNSSSSSSSSARGQNRNSESRSSSPRNAQSGRDRPRSRS